MAAENDLMVWSSPFILDPQPHRCYKSGDLQKSEIHVQNYRFGVFLCPLVTEMAHGDFEEDKILKSGENSRVITSLHTVCPRFECVHLPTPVWV